VVVVFMFVLLLIGERFRALLARSDYRTLCWGKAKINVLKSHGSRSADSARRSRKLEVYSYIYCTASKSVPGYWIFAITEVWKSAASGHGLRFTTL
jgi:hypothetical protein